MNFAIIGLVLGAIGGLLIMLFHSPEVPQWFLILFSFGAPIWGTIVGHNADKIKK